MGSRWWRLGAGFAVAATTLAGGSAQAATSGPTPARVVTITIPSDGTVASTWLPYPGPPRADVLLPAGYSPHRRYPLLVLLNGLNTDYSWFTHYGLSALFDGLGAIVVMPEGASGWYDDWWNDGERAGPAWESYELDHVIPTVLARYPILAQRRYHALAGVSMGGLGAAYLGGRLPGFFGSVATLSGFVDPQYDAPLVQPAMAAFSDAAAKGDDDPDPVYGPPGGFYADGHDPTLLVENLKRTRVFESTGTGVPSAADPDPGEFDTVAEGDIIYPMSERYHAALVAAGVDVTYQVHAGGHDIPDFAGEIRAMLAWGLFEPVPADPASWADETVATSGQLWDVDYRFARPPDQVVTFRQSGTSLSVSAAGSAVVVTTGSGCTIRTATPATLHLPDRDVVSAGQPDRVGRRACG